MWLSSESGNNRSFTLIMSELVTAPGKITLDAHLFCALIGAEKLTDQLDQSMSEQQRNGFCTFRNKLLRSCLILFTAMQWRYVKLGGGGGAAALPTSKSLDHLGGSLGVPMLNQT